MLKLKCFWLHLFHPPPQCTHAHLVFVAYLNVKTISSPALVASLKIPRCTLEIKVFNAFPFFCLSRLERSVCWWLLASCCGCWFKISSAPCWEQHLQPYWRCSAELTAGVCCNTRPGGFASFSSSMMLLWFLYQSCCELEWRRILFPNVWHRLNSSWSFLHQLLDSSKLPNIPRLLCPQLPL